MTDKFSSHQPALDSPAQHAADVVKSDSTDLANAARSLYIGNGGDIKVTTAGGDEITFGGVPSGSILPVRVTRVWSTGTDASNIVALW
jgi:hypothetical protein